MSRYFATVEWTTTDGASALKDIVLTLAEHGAHAATATDGRVGLALTVDSDDVRDAACVAVDLVIAALSEQSASCPEVTGVSVSSAADAPQPSTWIAPDILRVPDIAKLAGVSRQRALQWTREREDFPAAVITTSYGALYPRAAVERWLKQPRLAGRRLRSATASPDEGDPT